MAQQEAAKLPEGWIKTSIDSLVYLNKKHQNIEDDFDCSFVPMAMVPTKFGEPVKFEERKWERCKKGFTHFQDGDVLLAKITPCFENGKGAIVGGLVNGIGAGSTEYFVLRPIAEGIERTYLHGLLKTREFLASGEMNMAGSVGHKRVPKDFLLNYSVPLPPQQEQKRIVNKLDSLLAQVDTIQQRLDSLPDIIKRFRQSVLAAAVSGKLTEQWRVETGTDFGSWNNLQLTDVTSHVVDCPHSTPKWTEEGLYCVRTTAFSPFKLDMSSQGFVSQDTFDKRNARLIPVAGDILYSREGTVGIACQIPNGIELCLGQRMVVIRANEKISSGYLTMVLNSNHILSIVQSLTIGSTAPRVNMKVIREYPIPTPSIEEQTEIVRLVDQYFALADTLEKYLANAKARVDKLTQSILAKAFRGELVPQDPNDEPADKLLERIKAARIEAEKLEKAAKVSARKAANAKKAKKSA